MSFRGIDDVMPWIDLAYDVGHESQDLDAKRKYQPRCFNSHSWLSCPEGAKYILVYRDPCAAFYSLFNFLQGIENILHLDEFVKTMSLFPSEKTRVNYFDHLVSWWPKRNNPNVLFFLYEDMLEDLESAVKADFHSVQNVSRSTCAIDF